MSHPLPSEPSANVRAQYETADVCLIVEGAYPYVAGGVSSWIDQLLRAHSELRFHILALAPTRAGIALRYEIPGNVASVRYVFLADDVPGDARAREVAALCAAIEGPLTAIQRGTAGIKEMNQLVGATATSRVTVGRDFLESRAIWELIVRMYQALAPTTSFSAYFWSCKAMLSALLAVMSARLPPAKVYHTISTGYAGLAAARARVEAGRPAIVTEHGIYANERRIELLLADWLGSDSEAMVYKAGERNSSLRDMWIASFASYTKICYSACDKIITLYEGNQKFQLRDGAEPSKTIIIPNGIDPERFRSVHSSHANSRPTIGLIGRVVPIKDIKTYVRACNVLRQSFPDLRALVMGPTDEDGEYYEECVLLARQLGCEDAIEFTGKVNIGDYLGSIDVVVLTSLSEAQPLVVLEAGVAEIPVVSTDVGACREMILGCRDEKPRLGPGGDITALASPAATAAALARLLGDAQLRRQCGVTLRQRVLRDYDKKQLDQRYRELYDQLGAMPDRRRIRSGGG